MRATIVRNLFTSNWCAYLSKQNSSYECVHAQNDVLLIPDKTEGHSQFNELNLLPNSKLKPA